MGGHLRSRGDTPADNPPSLFVALKGELSMRVVGAACRFQSLYYVVRIADKRASPRRVSAAPSHTAAVQRATRLWIKPPNILFKTTAENHARRREALGLEASSKGDNPSFSCCCLPLAIRALRATPQPERAPSAQTHSSKPRTNALVSSRPPLNVIDLQVLSRWRVERQLRPVSGIPCSVRNHDLLFHACADRAGQQISRPGNSP